MPDDVLPFLGGIAILVLYLLWSAATEMGTRWPGARAEDRVSPPKKQADSAKNQPR